MASTQDQQMEALALYGKGLRRIMGFLDTMAIHALTKYGILEELKDGPKALEELAVATGIHVPSLLQTMRYLARHVADVLTELSDGRFSLGPLGVVYLRDGIAYPLWAAAIGFGEEIYQAVGDLDHTLETGENGFCHLYGLDRWEHFAQNSRAARVFNQLMGELSAPMALAVADAYDFSQVSEVVDVGGGIGKVLEAILRKHPNVRGTLLELPTVIEDARIYLEAAGLIGRCQIIEGSFFQVESIPVNRRVYILANVVHDWAREQQAQILRNLYEAMPEEGILLVVEPLMLPGNRSPEAKQLDLLMLALFNGHVPTEAEHRELLGEAGFRVRNIITTSSPLSVIEAIR